MLNLCVLSAFKAHSTAPSLSPLLGIKSFHDSCYTYILWSTTDQDSEYPGSVKRVGIFSLAAVGPFKLCPVWPADEKNEDNKEDNEEQIIEATTTR